MDVYSFKKSVVERTIVVLMLLDTIF